MKIGDYIVSKVPLNISKFFIEFAIQQTRSQIDRVRRTQNHYSTVVPVNSPLVRNKIEMALESLKSYSFYEDHNHSIDDLYMLANILFDLQEQLWI